jgi:hypothetical protein
VDSKSKTIVHYIRYWGWRSLGVVGGIVVLLLMLSGVRIYLQRVDPPFVIFEPDSDGTWTARAEYRVPESPYVYWRGSKMNGLPGPPAADIPGCRDEASVSREAKIILAAAAKAPDPLAAIGKLQELDISQWAFSFLFRGEIGQALDAYGRAIATCRHLEIVLPRGAVTSGTSAEVEMTDSRQSTINCTALGWHKIRPDHSPCGFSTIDPIEVSNTPSAISVHVWFYNWLHDDYVVDRCARLSVHFLPPPGWQRPPSTGKRCKPEPDEPPA